MSLYRLIVQAEPPFLAVHINAAFSRLTGINNSTVIGMPVSKIVALTEQLQSLPSHHESIALSSMREPNEQHPGSPGNTTVRFKNVDTMDQHDHDMEGKDKSNLNSHENAAAAGVRFANTEETDVSIERLIASSGFGQCHKVQTLDVRVLTSSSDNGSNNDSNNSSISSKDPPNNPTVCLMSVCPILNSSSQHSQLPKHQHTTSPSNNNSHSPPPKRRKHAHTQFRRYHKPSHFVVQLFPLEGEQQVIDPGKVPANVDIDASVSNDGSIRDGTTGNEGSSGDSSTSKAVVACG